MAGRNANATRPGGRPVHITIECPHCHERFQVDASLRGKAMRCPACRKVFDVSSAEIIPEVNEADFAPVPEETLPPPAFQSSGSVGDIIPLLNAEVAAPRPPQVSAPLPSPETVEASWASEVPLPLGQTLDVPPPPAPSWQQAPPVRKPGAAAPPPAPPPEPAFDEDASWLGLPPEPVAVEEAPPEVPLPEGSSVADWAPGNGAAPPVRGAGGATATLAAPAPAAAPRPPANPPNWPLRILAALVLLGVGSLGAFAAYIYFNTEDKEVLLSRQAKRHYQNDRFDEASKIFRELETDPGIQEKNRPRYHFMTGLSNIRDAETRARDSADEARKVRESLSEFVQSSREDPQLEKLLDEHREGVWKTYFNLVTVLEAAAKKQSEEPGPDNLRSARDLLGEAQKALAEADKFRPPGQGKEVEDIRNNLNTIEAAVVLHERRIEAVETIQSVVRRTSPMEAVPQFRELLAKESRALPDLPNDPVIRKLRADLPRMHLKAVAYTQVDAPPPGPVVDDIDRVTHLLIAPPVGDAVQKAPAREGVVFAVARGVLYALDAETGKPRWATRVGLDAARLPVWLPRKDKEPALVLVVSSDPDAVTAREALTGKPRWRHRLGSPCLGRPLLVDGRLYLPGYDGRIDELDLTGRLLGFFQVGRPLTAGGAHQEGTSLLYFPEDSYTVYALDVAKKECAGILYTGHPSGSLRCEPVAINGPEAGKGHLILCQADGVDAMKLRVFPLPIGDPDAKPLEPEYRLAGWASAPPYQNGETLAVVTDAGLLKLLGLKQKGNRDPELFPLLPQDVQLRGDAGGVAAQIAHSDGYQFWVLTQGGLHRLKKGFDRQTGPKLAELGSARELGSPLHASQADAEEQTLFVTALTPSGRSCRTTAINLGTDAVRWQRQLGLVPQAAPLGLGSRVLVQDRGGTLFLFDAGDVAPGGWAEAGQVLTALGPETALLRSLPAQGGHAALVLSFPRRGAGKELRVRRLAPGQKQPDAAQSFALPDGLSGVPGVWPDHLVLPLANGVLHRQALDEEQGVAGKQWRAAQAEPDAPGYVVPVGKSDFLVTDGSRGLRLFDWPQGQMGKVKHSAQLKRRIVTPPAVLPRAEKGALQVCVADAEGTLTFLEGDELMTVREWPLGGPVTAGPFVRGGEVGCVVEKRRLVWVNPRQEKRAWEYEAPADLVGEPVLAGGLLIVADQSGRVVALDPKTGKEAGMPYVFRGSVSPAAAPVPFGEGRLFVSLSDGTAAVLPLRLLGHPFRDFPAIW